MRIVRRVSCVAAIAATTGSAQIPPHAVRLPVSPQPHWILGDGDGVVALGVTVVSNWSWVHATRSTDGGRTWPFQGSPLPLSSLGAASRDGSVLVVTGNEQVFGPHIVASHDGGGTWGPALALSPMSLRAAELQVEVDGSDALLVWTDYRDVAGQGYRWTVRANRSQDGGRTWSSADAVLPGLLPQPTTSGLHLVAAGAYHHVFWSETDGVTTHTLHARSPDRGATWMPTRGIGGASLHRAAGSASVLLVADRSGAALQRSVDGGATWLPVGGHGVQGVFDVSVDGDRVLLVGRAPATAPLVGHLMLQMSVDAGARWLSTPYLVPMYREARAEGIVTPNAAFVHVAFLDRGTPPGAVLQSDDGGANWRLAIDAGWYAMAADADRALVIAQGALLAPDPWAFVLEGHTALGVGSAGSGGSVPTLQGRGLPGRGRTFHLDVAGCVGGAPGLVAATFGPAVDHPLGRARVYVGQPAASLPFVVGGTVGQPGVGGARTSIVVPNTAEVVGVRLLSQAFVVDAGAADGFAASNARETWIR